MINKKVSFVKIIMLTALALFFVLTGCPGPMGPAGDTGDIFKSLQYYTVVYNANGGDGVSHRFCLP